MGPLTSPAPSSRFHRALAVAWVAVLWLPLVQMVFPLVPEGPAVTENRRKAAVPQLTGWGFKEFDAFRKSFEAFFSDRFGFRDGLIRANSLVHVRGLRTSPTAAVVIGNEGWLYYDANDGVNLQDYCGLRPWNEKYLDKIERMLTSTRDELRRRGIAFAVLIAPNKHTIYPEHLPERIRALAGTTHLDQLAERLGRRPDILLVDVRRALLQQKARQPLYYRTDTHWNSYGAHLAARELLAGLVRVGVPVTPANDENLELELRDRPTGDLAAMLGLSGAGGEQEVLLRRRDATASTVTVLPPRKGQASGFESIVCETGKPGPRILLLQDSFGSAVFPALCQAFPHVAAYWGNRVIETELEQERPDVVVLEVAERYMGRYSGVFRSRDRRRPEETGTSDRP